MAYNDIINATFECVGGLLCWLNVKQLMRDKQVRGIHWGVQAFFASWGWWNVYYYPSLNQWASLVGALFLVSGNTAWVILALRYRKP